MLGIPCKLVKKELPETIIKEKLLIVKKNNLQKFD